MENMNTDNLGILSGIVISLGLFAMVFGIVYLYKRERMAMIERGMDPRRYKPQSAPFQNLKWGLLMMGAGLGLFIAYLLDHTAFNKAPDGDNAAIYFASIAVFGGLGLLASFLVEKKTQPKDTADKEE